MKNNKVLYGIICLVALIVTNVVVFVSVKDFTTARWINIGFLNLSVVISLIFSVMVGKKEYRFMNYSRFPIVAVYSVIAFIVSALFIAFNLKSTVITIVVQIILLGLFIIVVSSNTMANNSAQESLKNDKQQFNKIADLATRLEYILKTTEDRNLVKKIEKAYDDVKNSKLNISEDTTQVDNDILQVISIIEYNVQNKQFDLIDEQIDKIHNLVIKRNMMK